MYMSTGKKWLVVICTLVCLIGLALDMWGLYYYLYLKDNFTLTTAYVSDMSYSEEQKFFIEVQQYPNMVEFKVNCYTDVETLEKDEAGNYPNKYTYTFGVQFDGGYQATREEKKTGFLGLGDRYFYNLMTNCTYYNIDSNGTSYEAIVDLPEKDKWIYDIGGQLVLIKERGDIQFNSRLFGADFQSYDFSLMFEDLYKSVDSLDYGKRVVNFDLSQYFTFQMYNEENGVFEEEIHKTTETWMFVDVFVEKYSTDFVDASQSWFGQFMGDKDWTLYDFEKLDFWRARNEYNFDVEDFSFSFIDGKYYLKLQTGLVKYLEEFDNMKYVVNLDLDNIYLGSQPLTITGFTQDAFGKLEIDSINLKSENACQFTTYEDYDFNLNGEIEIVKLEVENV